MSIPQIIYGLMTIWGVVAIIFITKGFRNKGKTNHQLVNSVPSVFITLGVLGTFLGIVIGLQQFDVSSIDESIPPLLEGLKTAFYTSIVGMALSLIFSRITDYFFHKYGEGEAILSDEAKALNHLIEEIKSLKDLISSDNSGSLSTQLLKVRETIRDESKPIHQELTALKRNLGGDDETSLLFQIRAFRDEAKGNGVKLEAGLSKIQETLNKVKSSLEDEEGLGIYNYLTELNNTTREIGEKQLRKFDHISSTIDKNRELLINEFEKFSDLLAKNNTEILVEAIENVIGNFNEKLNELLERLVKENFEQLNSSVNKLNEWQKENAEMVDRLVQQFGKVANDFETSSESIKNITISTEKLTQEDGRLVSLIKELEDVLIKENQFTSSIETLHNITASYESTWDKANKWMEKHKDFTTSIEELIVNLKEIEQLRNQTDGFFTDIKNQLSSSIGILEGGNNKLMETVNGLDNSFQERLDKSFRSLDKILQSMVLGYADRLKSGN